MRKFDRVVKQSGLDVKGRQIQTQTTALIVALLVCCVFTMSLATSYFIHAAPTERIVLDNRVNPNTDSVESLMRLPNIGPSRAEAIVEYRRQFAVEGKPVFKIATDLGKIKGIGPKTVEKIKPWLCFE